MYCKKCSGSAFIMNIGHCSACGSMTSSGSHKLCRGCSTAKNECMHCRASLVPPTPNTPSKASFILAVDTDHYLTGPAPQGRDAIETHLKRAFASFLTDLDAWTASNDVSDLTVVNKMPNISTIVVECSESTGDKLKSIPGVAFVSVNGTVFAL